MVPLAAHHRPSIIDVKRASQPQGRFWSQKLTVSNWCSRLVGQCKGIKRERKKDSVTKVFKNVWQQLAKDDSGQDIAEYAVMLAVILVIVVGTIRLIGSNANNVFSNVASSIQ
jgi:Flp pilus assembly pilin Flp